MANAFNKEVVRSIAQSAGRFAAIAIISLLGAGFYAGLRMAAPDMLIAGDDFFDGGNLYDLSVVTTLGLDDESVADLGAIEGVTAVMPAYRADAMLQAGESSYAACIESLPVAAARASDTSDGLHAVSGDDGYLNRPLLLEGTWPAGIRDCVVDANAADKLGIGIGDELEVVKCANDVADTFTITHLHVSGLVNSPAYASSDMLGVTSLGTGRLDLYVYADPRAFKAGLPYTVAYLTADGARDAAWESGAYDAAVAPVKQRVQEAADGIGERRWQTVRADAQQELDDARAEYESERADAEAELADAADELAEAREKLDDAAAELADGAAQVYDAGVKIERNEKKLRKAEDEYAQGKAELDKQRAAFEKQAGKLSELKEQRKQLEGGIAQAKSGISQLEQGIASADATVKQLEYQLAQAKAASAPEEQIAQLEAGIKQAKTEASALPAQLKEAKGQLAALEAQQKQLDEGIATIEAGKQQLDAAQAKLDAARAELDSGWKKLEEGRAKYLSGFADYQSGVAEYEQGESDYADGLTEYEDGRAKADEKFADAEADLADAQADIDEIERPDVFVLDRTKNAGAAQLSSDADGIRQIAAYLPFMFFLVAALVSLTSMTRMVDEERMVIGTHKALGYGSSRITAKYLIYGVLASGVGSIAGVFSLGKLLPWFILVSYQTTYAVPGTPLPIDPLIAAKAIGLSVGVTAAATWGAAAASLREKPAALMLPRVPKAGKRIFLERIRPLWARMSFSHKVTARNLLRYKRRFFMAVVGIAGCTALLMVGFGLHDAIGGIVANQYEQLMNYDVAVRIDEDAPRAARDDVRAVLAADDVESYLLVDDFNLIARAEGAGSGTAADGDDELRIEVVVPQDADKLGEFITLRDRASAEALPLGDGQLIMTEKAATELGLQAGSAVTLYDENDVGDPTDDGRAFAVGGVAENYLGHYAYLLPDTYRDAFGQEPKYDLIYAKLADGADTAALSDALLSVDGVNTVSFVAEKIRTYEDMLDIMGKLIVIIIMLSAALAFVVLYNLTNINITERVREIATLKVLGFTRGEMNAYIFREIVVMSIIGALVGCVIGVPLTFYIAQAAETPQMMFGRAIEPATFVLSFAITLAFTAIVCATMRHKLYRVNMVESLKSVE